jgi:ArsR family transcriptional regulator, arsenate/arsenite/antimonite-responsive transcriptional repressor
MTALPAAGFELLAHRLAALGQPTRLALFCAIVRAGPAGCSVGELQAMLEIPLSTVSFHLRKLVETGLVRQVREGTVLRCCGDEEAMDTVLCVLREYCCPAVAAGKVDRVPVQPRR